MKAHHIIALMFITLVFSACGGLVPEQSTATEAPVTTEVPQSILIQGDAPEESQLSADHAFLGYLPYNTTCGVDGYEITPLLGADNNAYIYVYNKHFNNDDLKEAKGVFKYNDIAFVPIEGNTAVYSESSATCTPVEETFIPTCYGIYENEPYIMMSNDTHVKLEVNKSTKFTCHPTGRLTITHMEAPIECTRVAITTHWENDYTTGKCTDESGAIIAQWNSETFEWPK